MSEFVVRVVPITRIDPHLDADRIELAVIGEFRSVVVKGRFKTGDLVAYIPEASLVPGALLNEMNLVGKLAGSQKNRVKAMRFRGQLSQGICYPTRPGWVAGQDVTDELGITKYVPPIPVHLSGQVSNVGGRNTIRYDIENWKRYPTVLQTGEQVVFTEKIHGTFTGIGVLPECMDEHGDVVVFSKGIGAAGLAFKDVPENIHNLYIRVSRHFRLPERIRADVVFGPILRSRQPVFVLGEIFGVQDLKYGASTKQDQTMGFRVFDIFTGYQSDMTGRFLDDAELETACVRLGVPRVPIIWRGPFSRETMLLFTNGQETVSGKTLHVREGIVMRPVIERKDSTLPLGGRVQLKSISEDYLLRKGLETTEFE